MNLTPKECKLLAALLDHAADVYSDMTCDDISDKVLAKFTPEEKDSMMCEFHLWNGTSREYVSGEFDGSAHVWLRYFARMFAVGGEVPS